MIKRSLLLFITTLGAITSYTQNVGIGTTTPQSLLSVGPNSEYRVDGNGNLIRINNIAYSWPGTQGTAGQVLMNDGTGTLGWNSPASIFGDGSAGDLVVYSTDNPKYLNLGAYSLPNGYNYNFRNIRIEGRVFLAPGTVLKATGDVTIASGGLLVIQPNPSSSIPVTGVAATAADDYFGGNAILVGQTGLFVKAPSQAGGTGKMDRNLLMNGTASGTEGGGGVTIYAKGKITINGIIDAAGRAGRFSNTATIGAGPGGGGGGMIILASQNAISIGSTANIYVNGGDGAAAKTDGTNAAKGGGGGGGGGIIVLIAPGDPTINSSAIIKLNGGAAGANAGTVLPMQMGGGGGACGGNGGDGGGKSGQNIAATAGSDGVLVTVKPPNVEQYILGR